MRIMITGGDGFIGRHIRESLEGRGHEIVSTDREIDVAKMASIGALIGNVRPEVVIHCAAIAGVPDCDRDRAGAFTTNVIGTFTAAAAAAAYSVKLFIHFSTGGHMYGSGHDLFTEVSPVQPPSFYGETKRMSELALEAAVYDNADAMRIVILRPGNVYGPGGRGAIEKIEAAMVAGEDVHVTGTGTQSRDYIHVDDVTRLIRLIVTANIDEHDPRIYNVGTGVRWSVNDIVRELRELTGWTGEVVNDAMRSFDPDHVALDSTRALRIFDWVPLVTFEQGIRSLAPVPVEA